jgi:hypothetical protein
MRTTLMRSALILFFVLVSVSACSGSSTGGEQALTALEKHFRADMEDFAAISAWKNRSYQFEDNSGTVSAIMTADVITDSGSDYGNIKAVCNYKLTDTSWSLVNGLYYEQDLLTNEPTLLSPTQMVLQIDRGGICNGQFPRE